MKKVFKILSTEGDDAGFKVTFSNGIGGAPEIEITGLNISGDCADDIMVGALKACGNYLLEQAESIHAQGCFAPAFTSINNSHSKDK